MPGETQEQLSNAVKGAAEFQEGYKPKPGVQSSNGYTHGLCNASLENVLRTYLLHVEF